MTSTYDELFSHVLRLIRDYEFLRMGADEIRNCLGDYLVMGMSDPYLARLFTSFDIDDSAGTIQFELKRSTITGFDKIYVEGLLARAIVIGWLESQVNSTLNIQQIFGGKEQKFYSQAAHLEVIEELLESHKIELRKRIRDRGYIHNSYVEGE